MVEFVRIRDEHLDAVRALLEEVQSKDGIEALSEHKANRVAGGADVVAIGGFSSTGRLTAYAQAAWHRPVRSDDPGHWAVEIVVAPESRGDAGVVHGLVSALEQHLGDRERVAVWAAHPYIVAGLESAGYEETRRLLRLRRSLPIAERPSPSGEVAIELFRLGIDDAEWLQLNNAAFAGHPENGALEQADLDERTGSAWFDPRGFFVARKSGVMVGSCWTKVHDGGIGEIYIIAVSPQHHGRGIGRALLLTGADHLARRRDATQLILYVEGDNASGLQLYGRLGFETDAVSRQYERTER